MNLAVKLRKLTFRTMKRSLFFCPSELIKSLLLLSFRNLFLARQALVSEPTLMNFYIFKELVQPFFDIEDIIIKIGQNLQLRQKRLQESFIEFLL
jgi:hypothetical protein